MFSNFDIILNGDLSVEKKTILLFFASCGTSGHEQRTAALAKAFSDAEVNVVVISLGSKTFTTEHNKTFDFGDKTFFLQSHNFYATDSNDNITLNRKTSNSDDWHRELFTHISKLVDKLKPISIGCEAYPLSRKRMLIFKDIATKIDCVDNFSFTRDFINPTLETLAELGVTLDGLLPVKTTKKLERMQSARHAMITNALDFNRHYVGGDGLFSSSLGTDPSIVQAARGNEELPNRFLYAGYIAPLLTRSPNLMQDGILLVSGSGHTDSEEINRFSVLYDHLISLSESSQTKLTVVLGAETPLMLREKLEVAAETNSAIRVLGKVTSAEHWELMQQHKVVFCRGGLNTMYQYLAAGTIPIITPNLSDPEQIGRAAFLNRMYGYPFYLNIEPQSIVNDAKSLLEGTKEVRWPETLNCDGARFIAEHTLQSLGIKRPYTLARQTCDIASMTLLNVHFQQSYSH